MRTFENVTENLCIQYLCATGWWIAPPYGVATLARAEIDVDQLQSLPNTPTPPCTNLYSIRQDVFIFTAMHAYDLSLQGEHLIW